MSWSSAKQRIAAVLAEKNKVNSKNGSINPEKEINHFLKQPKTPQPPGLSKPLLHGAPDYHFSAMPKFIKLRNSLKIK